MPPEYPSIIPEHPSIIIDVRENGTARVDLDRPPLNVMNIAMMREIHAALDGLRSRKDVKLVVSKRAIE
jgi:enoyl-CoA hydratase/carnithine racemase